MKKDSWKQAFHTRTFKSGTQSAVITVIAIAIVVVIHLIMNGLPATMTKLDFSFNQMYTLTDQTEEFVTNMKEDVTIYVMAVMGTEDTDVIEILDKYQALSSHIIVEQIDPVLHPNFTTQYTEEVLSNGSLLVVSDKRSDVVLFEDMFQMQMNQTTFTNEIIGWDAEGQITSALNYVTTDQLSNQIYTLEGHGELEIAESFISLIDKNSMYLTSMNLLMEDTVPEDAACVLINAPRTDISAEEAEKLIAYLEQGGTALIANGVTTTEFPNLNQVLEYYGVSMKAGLVMEGDPNYYVNPDRYYLLPALSNHEITSSLATTRANVFIPQAQALFMMDEARSTIAITPILTTSANSFLRVLENAQSTSMAQVEGDVSGPITVGAVISETHQGIETKLVVYTTPFIMDEGADSVVNGNNYELVKNSLSWLCDLDASIVIPAKSFAIETLQVTAQDVSIWIIIVVIIIPLTVLGFGFTVWLRRRRK